MDCENIAFSCLTKHVLSGDGDKTAVRWINSDLSAENYSFNYFETNSNIYANVLHNAGIKEKDVVSIYLPRSPELISLFFGVLKNNAICSILFSTLGEEGLLDRLSCNDCKIIFTKKSLLKRITPILDKLGALKFVILIDSDDHSDNRVLSLQKLAASCNGEFTFQQSVNTEFPAFMQFTSGSTGKPKAALHVHSALADMVNSFSQIIQCPENEVFWCTADPAWITGLVYGILTPFTSLTSQMQFGGAFDPFKWLSILQGEKVNNWYTAPTALRMLMQENQDFFTQFSFADLRKIFSVGEPLNPEIFSWGKKVFQKEIHDTWFQSETGCIMIGNRPGITIKPGSMGKPRDGITVFICDEEMHKLPPKNQGKLCLAKGWSAMFRTYYNNNSAYSEKFRSDLYITGDIAWQDEDGYFWYVSRSDDVINTAGHLVGPFEVESALLEMPEILDVAVIGTSDPILHQKIVAFVSLAPGIEWSKMLELKARVHVSNHVSTVAAPSDFRIVTSIPKNQSGKILRRVLKAWYEGKDPGDISTME